MQSRAASCSVVEGEEPAHYAACGDRRQSRGGHAYDHTHDGVEVQHRLPVFSEDVKADIPFQVDIRMIDLEA